MYRIRTMDADATMAELDTIRLASALAAIDVGINNSISNFDITLRHLSFRMTHSSIHNVIIIIIIIMTYLLP